MYAKALSRHFLNFSLDTWDTTNCIAIPTTSLNKQNSSKNLRLYYGDKP